MPCSAVTLSLATITAIVSVAMLAISFSTDNWTYTEVKRAQIQQRIGRGDVNPSVQEDINSSYLYYTRTRGLFRICFPKERPTAGVVLYLSPVETYCMNVDYYIPDEENMTKGFSEDARTRLHMARSVIALFIVAFFTVFVAFWTGVAGCWRRSPGNITATAILMLLSCLLSAGGMGLWHGVEYYEKEKLIEPEFYRQWPEVLQDESKTSYDWSFFVSWLSVAFSLISSILFAGASHCVRSEQREEKAKGVQYVMPVYPQKQQYAYGYAYPGPYYHGSQYGPYNY